MNLLQKTEKELEDAAEAFLNKLGAVLFDTHFALAKKEFQKIINLAAKVGALQQVNILTVSPKEETEDKN